MMIYEECCRYCSLDLTQRSKHPHGNANLTLLKVDSEICTGMGIYYQAISDSLDRIRQIRHYHSKTKS